MIWCIKMKARVLIAPLALWVILASCEQRAQVLVRRADDLPAPRTLAALRMKHGVDSLPPCVFPSAAKEELIEIAAPDTGLRLRLPPAWALRRSSETRYDGTPEAVLDGPSGARIRVSRIISGAIGAHWLTRDQRSTPARGTRCEVAQDSAGSIWTLYAPGAVFVTPDTAGRIISRSSAVGDVITPAGLRYHVTIHADSERYRDELAGVVAASALTTSYRGVE